MKKVIRLSLLGLIVVGMVSITGCLKQDKDELSKEEYISLYEDAIASIEDMNNDIESLKMELNAYGVEMTEDDINQPYELIDNGETKVYNTFNDYIIIKNKIDWGATDSLANTSKIMLNEVFSLMPSSTWSVKLSSGNTTLYNDANIAGSVKLNVYYDEKEPVSLYNEHLRGYLEDIGAKKITNNFIYLDGSEVGVLTRSILSVKKKVDIEESVQVREDYLRNGNKEVLDTLEKEEEEKGSKDTESKSDTDDKSEASLDGILEDTGLSDTIDTSGNGNGVSDKPEDTSKPEETTKPKYRNVVIKNTEDKNVNYIYYVGAINSNSKILEFKFMFEADDNSKMKEELIMQLLKTITIEDVNVTLQ